MPALFTRMFTAPSSLAMEAAARSTEPRFVTSHSTANAFPPDPVIAFAVSSRCGKVRPQTATAASIAASRFAMEAPMPRPPPVTTAFAQTSNAPQQKVIKDPTEYNAYITATQLTDPNQKAAALETFVTTYPNSVVKEDALATEMAAYQQAGNAAKSAEVAQRVLQANPNNVPALVVTVYGKLIEAKTKND